MRREVSFRVVDVDVDGGAHRALRVTRAAFPCKSASYKVWLSLWLCTLHVRQTLGSEQLLLVVVASCTAAESVINASAAEPRGAAKTL